MKKLVIGALVVGTGGNSGGSLRVKKSVKASLSVLKKQRVGVAS